MPAGLLQMPQLPGCIFEERIQVDYGNAKTFWLYLRLRGLINHGQVTVL